MELTSNPMLIADWLRQPWHWAFSGAMLSLLVFLMTWMGKSFGISTIVIIIKLNQKGIGCPTAMETNVHSAARSNQHIMVKPSICGTSFLNS